MDEIINVALNQGFAIAVCVYLLYERTKFNIKISDSLKEIAVVIRDIFKKEKEKDTTDATE